MSSEEDVLRALKALAEADADKEARPEVEMRLRQAVRRKRRKPVWTWAMAAAAAMVMILTAALYFQPRRPEPIQVARPAPKVEPAPSQVARPQEPVRVVAKAPARRRVPREVVTDFFPLMEVAPPLNRGELVRVSLPASAMRTVGLPVREDRLMDRVQADVLVSEEGWATAIRFVKYQ